MKKKVLIGIIIIFMANIHINVYASSFKFGAKTETTELVVGDTITIDLSVSDIQVGELGINTVEGYLEYDENIFEKVTQEDIEGKNEWLITYNSGEGERKGKYLAVLLKSGQLNNSSIGKIKMKVKDYIEAQETTIRFTKIATNDGEKLVEETDKEIKLRISSNNNGNNSGNQNGDEDNGGNSDGSNGSSNGNNNGNSDGSNNGSSSGNQGNKNNYNANDSLTDERIPKTGAISGIAIIIGIALLIIISLIAIKKYRIYKIVK